MRSATTATTGANESLHRNQPRLIANFWVCKISAASQCLTSRGAPIHAVHDRSTDYQLFSTSTHLLSFLVVLVGRTRRGKAPGDRRAHIVRLRQSSRERDSGTSDPGINRMR